ncbi:3-hydroxyisobutyrate dehydrogenase [Legionella birminghamensis]|uniref:3-hydroxyisobutyrate dehydrogenase n=1 Tax=Legionella birminghamensis TaxID=28083 RepID=A0A378ICY6_9GAMM|nr:3-hydroxyisobutyrate dehydrogenase [Legionella birminghamensis]KTC75319.1 3-hydroxyisobutyrate dehydrogenase [Legionella birminghamensis]STX33087.1 3-hydroxyisobutyrate dehydrogenase [Legionella birminghamensis]
MARIGFVGLGHMGLPMAINLVKAGHDVTGFDLQAAALDALIDAGGFAARKLQEAADGNEIIITMLQSGAQVEQVCLGETGLYAAAKHATHIDCSSIDVQTSRKLHQQASEKHLLSLDAPVSGGVAGAKAGSLTFMVGGREYALEKVKPVLNNMGQRIIYAGNAGSGQAAKVCNNMILGVTMIAVSEAFNLAQSLGLSAEKLHEVVNSSSGQCWVTSKYMPVPDVIPDVPANNNYQPGFTVAMMLKDLLLSQKAASMTGLHTPVSERATLLYQQFSDAGFSDLDFSAIIKALNG